MNKQKSGKDRREMNHPCFQLDWGCTVSHLTRLYGAYADFIFLTGFLTDLCIWEVFEAAKPIASHALALKHLP